MAALARRQPPGAQPEPCLSLPAGERYSLVVWFSESEDARAAAACPWVERAAAAGSAPAQFVLGGFRYRGEFGARRDAAAAARSFERAAAQGHPHAQLWAATLRANGEGVSGGADYGAAHTFWEAAAAQGLAGAQYSLGSAYKHGHGVAACEATAARHYAAAAAQGHGWALEEMGKRREWGRSAPAISIELVILTISVIRCEMVRSAPELAVARLACDVLSRGGHIGPLRCGVRPDGVRGLFVAQAVRAGAASAPDEALEVGGARAGRVPP